MVPVRRRSSSGSAALRAAGLSVALVALLLASSLTVFGSAPVGSGAASPHAPASPHADSAPTIFFFEASQGEVLVNTSMYFFVDAYGAGTLDYAYSGLPPGCFSADTSFLFCTPTVPGYYNITVSVTSNGAGPAATSFAHLSVDPVVEGNFFSLNSSVATWPNASAYDCSSIITKPFYQYFCDPEVQSPSLVPLDNGSVGVAYQQETTVSDNPCGQGGATVARVQFQVSNDSGATFGNATDIGNDTCSYLNSIEPAFAASNGTIYGAFIEENSSAAPWMYLDRSGDALGFVSSTNVTNVTANFSAPVTVADGGNLAHPAIAAVGSTIYLVYEDLANSSSPIGGGVLPISVQFLSSTDGGLSWSTPQLLPGLGAGSEYSAGSPAIAVSSAGTVTVAYATDRACLSGNGSNCSVYGDSIVSVSSSTNGSSWGAPVVVATGAAETSCFSGGCVPGYFESLPEVTLTYAPNSTDAYLVYAAAYDQGAGLAGNFNHSGLFAAASTDSGASWSSGPLDAPSGSTAVRFFEPGLAASSSEVYLSYLEANETPGQFGFANSLTDFVQTLPNGATSGWSVPTATDIESFVSGGSVNSTRSTFAGFTSAVTVTTNGRPMIAFALPEAPVSTIARSPTYYYANTSTPGALVVGAFVEPTDADALTILFNETGIPSGVGWQLYLDGVGYSLTTPQIEFVNVPANEVMMLGAYFTGGFWTVSTTYFNQSLTTFYGNETYVFAFEVWVGIEFNSFPSLLSAGWSFYPYGFIDMGGNLVSSPFPAYVYASFEMEGGYYCTPVCMPEVYNYVDYFSSLTNWGNYCQNLCNWSIPWYFPLGSQMQFYIYSWNYYGLTPAYWTGTGPGSYTGQTQGFCFYAFDCNAYSGIITMDGAINETIWLADAPVNLSANLGFTTYGLPSTSVFHFDLNGVPYSANASSGLSVPDQAPGSYDVTNVWASAATPGWEYFGGTVGPDPFLSPVLTQINLTFTSLVHVKGPLGTVSFHAPALSPGTYWSLSFNGTTYASTTPWINLTSHGGTYPFAVHDSAAPTGTAGYVPEVNGTSISVKPGTTYTVDFVPAYLVRALASSGGLVSINGEAPQGDAMAWVPSGYSVPIQAYVASGYAFVGWGGQGTGSYSGPSTSTSAVANGPLVESAAFEALPGARFNLTFVENGLPAGTWWTAQLGASGYSTNASALTVHNLWPWSATSGAGIYPLSIATVYLNSTNLTRFTAVAPLPTVIGTNGSYTPFVPITFTAQSLFQLDSLGGGIVDGTYGGGSIGSSDWLPYNASVSIVATPNPGYVFVGWVGTGPGAYTGSESGVTVTAMGPVTEVASFAPQVAAAPPRYTLTFQLATPVAPGTVWSIVLGGQGYSSEGQNLSVPGLLAGNYPISVNTATAPGGLIQYRATPTDPAAYTVSANKTIGITYALFYWVNVGASTGGTVSPGNGFYAADSVLYLVATPQPGMTFSGWTGAGRGNYTGTNTTASVFVLAPLTEQAAFQSSGATAAASSVFSNPDAWIGIGAVALIVGLVVGVVVARMSASSAAGRRTRPPSSTNGRVPGGPGP